MERLTKPTVGTFKYSLKDHEYTIGEFTTYDAFFDFSMAVKKLGEYEDSGIEPEAILKYNEMSEINDALADLIEYKDLEEQGRLIKLPRDESYAIQSQCEAAESMINDIYQSGIIGETAYNVINQALQSMREIVIEREGME